ncbi:ANTAR domain-containing protein [Nocardioides sp. MAHUQ-72]|uniref:ANTAR domain-containing protein n=1 Tax=unclassified Nocardioides TaxID=2615069 RepID=UPI003619F9C5
MTQPEDVFPHPVEFEAVLHASDQLTVAASAVTSVVLGLLDVDAVGLALHGPGGSLVRLSATSALVDRLDRTQADLGEGPGLGVFDVGSERFMADARVDERWPGWSRAAVGLGLLSVHMTALAPLRGHGVSLDLYSHRAHGITAATVAAVAALSLPSALDLAAIGRLDLLERTMRARQVLGQAQGILMERHELTAPQAQEVLDRRASGTGLTVDVLARSVAQGVPMPWPPGPRDPTP